MADAVRVRVPLSVMKQVRDGAVRTARQTHDLEVIGSNPIPVSVLYLFCEKYFNVFPMDE